MPSTRRSSASGPTSCRRWPKGLADPGYRLRGTGDAGDCRRDRSGLEQSQHDYVDDTCRAVHGCGASCEFHNDHRATYNDGCSGYNDDRCAGHDCRSCSRHHSSPNSRRVRGPIGSPSGHDRPV